MLHNLRNRFMKLCALAAGTVLGFHFSAASAASPCTSSVSSTTASSLIPTPLTALTNPALLAPSSPPSVLNRPTQTTGQPNIDVLDGGCVSELSTPFNAGAPYMILGPDGALWFSASGSNGPTIGRVETHFPFEVTEFGPLTGGALQLTIGPDDNIWFVEQGSFDCSQSPPSLVGRILADKPYTITEFPVPGPISPLYGIATGADGNLWFTRLGNPGGCTPAGVTEIDRIIPHPPYTITRFPIPSFGAAIDAILTKPEKIVAGSDDHLWFNISPFMGRISPFDDHKVEVFPIPGATGNFADINVGPASDPDSIWFIPIVNGSFSMGRIETKPPHAMTLYPMPGVMGAPNSVSPGPDGNMWFTVARTGWSIDRFSVRSPHVVTEFALPDTVYSRAATCGPDGNVWFTETQNPLGHQGIPGKLGVVHGIPGLGTEGGAAFCWSLARAMRNGGQELRLGAHP
jgi:virginiamycin B lyase